MSALDDLEPPANLDDLPPPSSNPSAIDPMQHPFNVGVGMAENALGSVTAGAGSLADALTGSDPGTHNWGYRPRTEAGQGIAEAVGKVGHKVGQAYDTAFGTGPLATTIKERGPEAMGAIGTITGIGPKLLLKGGASLGEEALANSPRSISAAAASPQLASASPELQGAVQQARAAQAAGQGRINMDTLNRHVEAESLPVPVKLTKGQATQDPATISLEQNSRGKVQGLADRFNEQNQALAGNIQEIRDRVGPDVFTTNQAEHGDTLIEAYKAKNEAAQTQISAKYQALKDANGGQFPVDAQQLLDNASAGLHKQLLFDAAPKSVMNTLGRLADNGNMTFENFESLRTNLARIQRSFTADGNERAAAGVIRDSMEQLPLAPGAAKLKPLADAARSAAKAQFDALDADPAYKAAVNDSVSPDKFTRRFVIGGNRDDVATMRQNLADNPTATQTMSVAALDHLRDQGIKSGNFTQAGYNRAFQSLDPKLNSLVDPKTAEDLSTLGRVAGYTQGQPRGSFVNNSNTTVAAHASGMGKNILEGLINAKTGGVGGTLGRKFFEGRAIKAAAAEHLAPGAGILEPAP